MQILLFPSSTIATVLWKIVWAHSVACTHVLLFIIICPSLMKATQTAPIDLSRFCYALRHPFLPLLLGWRHVCVSYHDRLGRPSRKSRYEWCWWWWKPTFHKNERTISEKWKSVCGESFNFTLQQSTIERTQWTSHGKKWMSSMELIKRALVTWSKEATSQGRWQSGTWRLLARSLKGSSKKAALKMLHDWHHHHLTKQGSLIPRFVWPVLTFAPIASQGIELNCWSPFRMHWPVEQKQSVPFCENDHRAANCCRRHNRRSRTNAEFWKRARTSCFDLVKFCST